MPWRAYQSCVTGWLADARKGRRGFGFRVSGFEFEVGRILPLGGVTLVRVGKPAVITGGDLAAFVFRNVAAGRKQVKRHWKKLNSAVDKAQAKVAD